jgi:hypothetical protein
LINMISLDLRFGCGFGTWWARMKEMIQHIESRSEELGNNLSWSGKNAGHKTTIGEDDFEFWVERGDWLGTEKVR